MQPSRGLSWPKSEANKDALAPGSVSRAEGLEAWKRIEVVVTHPRCANCHVDARAIPMWWPAGESRARVRGMNIHGGESRIGAETIRCSTCHPTSTAPNDPAPAPLRAGSNGGRDAVGLREHLRHDASLFIPRRWEPGAGRATPPGTFEDHVKDVTVWGAAGQPCPN